MKDAEREKLKTFRVLKLFNGKNKKALKFSQFFLNF